MNAEFELFAGAGSPEAIGLRLTTKSHDFRLVTAVTSDVYKPRSAIGRWTWIIDVATVSTLELRYVLNPNRRDVEIPGEYSFQALLEFPGSIFRRSRPIEFVVRPAPGYRG